MPAVRGLLRELEASRELHDITSSLIAVRSLEDLRDAALGGAARLMRADMASVQLLQPAVGELDLLGWTEFHPTSAAFWQRVHAGSGSSCGEALVQRRQIVVPDVNTCVFLARTADLDEYRRSGIRAVQSTPLVTGDGKLVGMLSTHWRRPHRPSARELRLFDRLSRQVADLLERASAQARLDARARVLEMIATGRPLGEILAATARLVDDQGGGLMASVLAIHPEGGRFESGGASTLPDEYIAHLQQTTIGAPYASPCSRAADLGRASLSTDIERDDRWSAAWRGAASAVGVRSCAALPIAGSDGRRLGVLAVHLRAAGDPLPVHQPIVDEAVHLAGVAIERQQAEAGLLLVSRRKDEFVATLSHELRTPLNVALGWVQVLRTGSIPPDSRERALEALARSLSTQAELVDDLLDVSRIGAGKLQIRRDPVDLADVILSAVDTAQKDADARQIELVTVQWAPSLVVLGDATRLVQIVSNLLSNAIKFTLPGGQVRIEAKTAGEMAEIAVSDTGEGIDPDFLPHVFDRFRQADGAGTNRRGGLGLGLAIVRHLTEAHAGEVSAESAGRNQGATFRVRLPLAPGDSR